MLQLKQTKKEEKSKRKAMQNSYSTCFFMPFPGPTVQHILLLDIAKRLEQLTTKNSIGRWYVSSGNNKNEEIAS